MKKIFTIVATFALTVVTVNAQTRSSEMVATLGYSPVGGVLNYQKTFEGRTHIRPVTLGVDYGVMCFGKAVLAVGVQISEEIYTHSATISNDLGEATFNSLIPQVRISYHYPLLSNLDINGGIALGYNFLNLSNKINGIPLVAEDYRSTSEFAWSPYIGVKFYVLGGLGVYADFGFGNISKYNYVYYATTQPSDVKKNNIFLNLGLAYKF